MKRNIINFITTIILAIILSMFFPWWSLMIAAFLASIFVSLKKSNVFLIPFISIATLWIIQAFYLSSSNDFILAKKIALLLPLNGNVTLLLVITGIIGGLAAGVSGVFGKQFLKLLNK